MVNRPSIVRLLDAVRIQNWKNDDISKEEFVVNAFRSISCGLNQTGSDEVARKMFNEVGIRDGACIRVEGDKISKIPPESPIPNVVATELLLQNAESLLLWLRSPHSNGIAIIGPDGSGKSTLLKHSIRSLYSA